MLLVKQVLAQGKNSSSSNVALVPAGVDPVELLLRYEPVIRFTEASSLV